jgi:hypothetical protein
MDVMQGSLSCMLGEEEVFSEDLTGHSSRLRSDSCGWAARSGSGSDLSSDESEFLRKRNPKEGGKWMLQWFITLPTVTSHT